jgi:hypothetical protein
MITDLVLTFDLCSTINYLLHKLPVFAFAPLLSGPLRAKIKTKARGAK